MPRRPATITQADVARAIRAAKQAGAHSVLIDGVIVRGLEEIADEQSQAVETDGFIYVAGFAQFVKIGFTKHVANRVYSLEGGLPSKLTLYASFRGSQRQERAFHKRFAKHRKNGEWFINDGELAAWIRSGCPA